MRRCRKGSDSTCSFSTRTWITSSSCSSAVIEADLISRGSTSTALEKHDMLLSTCEMQPGSHKTMPLACSSSHVTPAALKEVQELVQAGVCLQETAKMSVSYLEHRAFLQASARLSQATHDARL